MELQENTSIIISVGTLIAIIVFVWRISAKVTRVEQNVKSNQHRIDKIEKEFNISEIRERLARIEATLEMIMTELKKK
jgi:hypothetical protein